MVRKDIETRLREDMKAADQYFLWAILLSRKLKLFTRQRLYFVLIKSIGGPEQTVK